MRSVSEFQGPRLIYKSSHRLPLSYEGLGFALAACDAFIITATSYASVWAYAYANNARANLPSIFEFGAPLGASFVIGALYIASAHARGLYRPSSLLPNGTAFTKLLTNWCGVFLFGSLAAFLLKIGDQFSRGAIVLYFFAGGFALGAHRYFAGRLLTNALQHGGLRRRRIALIRDTSPIAPNVVKNDVVHSLSRHGYEIVRSYSASELTTAVTNDGKLACDDLVELNRDGKINEIVLCAGAIGSQQLSSIMHQLRRIPVSVKLIPDDELRFFLQRRVVDIGPSLAIELQRRPCSAFEQTVKRLFDIAFALIGLLSLWPMMLMIAALIRLDSPGPILFSQGRTGLNGRTFRIYKFRTMTASDDGKIVRQATRRDPRVTKVGRWLRSTSLDELPQLLNVVRGDMSIIGPRPHAIAHDIEYGKLLSNYALRYRMLPGITGLAQVAGYRGETPTTELMAKRVKHDLWYIDNWSLALDIKILFRTVYAILKIRDVY